MIVLKNKNNVKQQRFPIDLNALRDRRTEN